MGPIMLPLTFTSTSVALASVDARATPRMAAGSEVDYGRWAAAAAALLGQLAWEKGRKKGRGCAATVGREGERGEIEPKWLYLFPFPFSFS